MRPNDSLGPTQTSGNAAFLLLRTCFSSGNSPRPLMDYWDRIATDYASTLGMVTAEIGEEGLRHLRIGEGSKFLDVGCGPGKVTSLAAALGADAIGVDTSEKMLLLASEEYPSVSFRLGDAYTLPFPTETFDTILLNFVLVQLKEPEAALTEILRVLRPGGRCLFTAWKSADEAAAFGIAHRAVNMSASRNGYQDGFTPFFADDNPLFELQYWNRYYTVTEVLIHKDWSVQSAAALLSALTKGTARTAAMLRGVGPSAKSTLISQFESFCRPFQIDGSSRCVLPMRAKGILLEKTAGDLRHSHIASLPNTSISHLTTQPT